MQKLLIVMLGFAALSIPSCRQTSVDPLPLTYHDITEVHVINIDGTGEKVLTADKQIVWYANFLPNGGKIIYLQSPINSASQTIYSMNTDGTGKTVLASSKTILKTSSKINDIDTSQRILFTPDSKKIIYSAWSRSIGTGKNVYAHDIYCINTDGSNEINLTNNGNRRIGINNIALSNDGQQILFSEYDLNSAFDVATDGECRICTMGIDGTNRKVVKKFRSVIPLFPQYLPSDNGTIIYLAESLFDAEHSYIRRFSVADTSHDIPITTFVRVKFYPVIVSSDKMIFDNNVDLVSIDLLNGTQQIIPSLYPKVVQASPNRAFIAVGSYGNDMYISPSSGINMTTLHSPGSKEAVQPFLSPDNQRVVFRSLTSIKD